VAGYALDYAFHNASAVVEGTRETITGDFGFDPLTLIQYGADIQLTGGLYAGEYIYDAELSGPNAITAEGSSTFLHISFKNNLSSDEDPLANVLLEGAGFGDPAPTGYVCPVGCAAAAPEPASLAILGSALGLLFLGPWADPTGARMAFLRSPLCPRRSISDDADTTVAFG
jgi:hypothetical protein